MPSTRQQVGALIVVMALACLGYMAVTYGVLAPPTVATPSAVIAAWSAVHNAFGRLSGGTGGSGYDDTLPIKTILFWKKLYKSRAYGAKGLGRKAFAECPVSACTLTDDQSLLASADAVLFHIPAQAALPRFRPPHQLYVFCVRESPHYAKDYFVSIKSDFNLTMTYRRDSDLPNPVSLVVPLDGATSAPPRNLTYPLAQRRRSVAWVVSHCRTHSQRERYVMELKKHIDVYIFGACGSKNSLCDRADPERSCFTHKIPRHYKFYLGFENSVCKDYITEKSFRTLKTEIVPVVYGGANYTRDLPPRSVINVQDFKSPRQLAAYLTWLGNNETEYLKYFEWKNKYRIASDTQRQFCRLCEKLHDPTFSRTYEDVYRWWQKGTCHDDDVLSTIMDDPVDIKTPSRKPTRRSAPK